MSDDKNKCVNQCAIDELIEYSLNVQECEDRAAEIREAIADKRKAGIHDKENELSIWRNEGIEIHSTYIHYAQFNRQRCVTDLLNDETLDQLALGLAETHENEIDRLVTRN